MMNAKRNATPSGGSVVLMREDVSGCTVLLRALSARGLPPQVVRDEPGAMVALAGLMQRGTDRRVLIVVEPMAWPRLDELLTAVDDYCGSVHCWRFDNQDGASPMLSQIQQASYPFDQSANRTKAQPVGHIRKRKRTVDRLLVPAPGREESTRDVVTQQELTMLLGPVPGEAS